MALGGSPLSLPLLLLTLFLVSLVGESRKNYRIFLREHIDPDRTLMNPHAYCEEIMNKQGLTTPTCTEKNTFIHAKNIHVKNICGVGGIHHSHMLSDSRESYVITTCHYTGGHPPYHCKYRGLSERRRIRVACFRGVPVELREILYIWP